VDGRSPGATDPSTVKSVRLPTVLLGALNLGLGALIAMLWHGGQLRVKEPETLIVPPLTLPDLSALNSTPMPSVDAATIRDQSVFYVSRSFYTPPPPPVEIPAPAYDFSGTMRLADGKRIAFVKGKTDLRSRTLHVGDDVDGWHVQAIEADRVILDRSEQTAELTANKTASPAGLIRGPVTPRIAQTGIRVLGATDSGTPRSAASDLSARARTYQPPPPLRGK
jgi:hypothetical protein